MDIDLLTGLGLDSETAQALLEMIREESAVTQPAMPRVVSATPGAESYTEQRERFAGMGYSQRLALKRENPQLYSQLAKA